MAFMDKLKVLWGKAFVGGEWKVGYRLRNEPHGQYCLVDTPAGTWAADPFLYEANGEHYLFVELYEEKKNKACIAYYRFIDGVPVYQDKIIDQPYHMSYPCVFEYNGEHYMIPETSANQSIDLYRATEFPKKWDKVETLLSGARYVDTTVLSHGNRTYAMSYRKITEGWELCIFALDLLRRKMTLVASKHYTENTGRPAGHVEVQDKFIRPTQDCHRKYGEALIINEIDEFDELSFEEHEIRRITANEIVINGVQVDRIHTWNIDSTYCVLDVFSEKFDLFHGIKIFRRAVLSRLSS